MAPAVAVGTAKTSYRFTFLADFAGNSAFFRFAALFEKHFDDFGSVVAEQVVYVPECALFASEVTLQSLPQVFLGGTDVRVRAFLEGFLPQGANIYADVTV